MENERHSLEKAQEEAGVLVEKVEKGEARNYTEAEKQLYLQGLIWKQPSGFEVNKLSNEVEVNTLADSKIHGADTLKMADLASIAELSGTKRLIDLGSSDTFIDGRFAAKSTGAEEYIAVDLGIDNKEFIHDGIKVKHLNSEILRAIHRLPDNYANAFILGIQGGNVIQGYELGWSYAVLAELKRVVPEKGFILADFWFLFEAFRRIIPEYERFRDLDYKLNGITSDLKPSEEQHVIDLLDEYKVTPDDPYYKYLDKYYQTQYVIDSKELGFRLYFSRPDSLNPVLIINENKTKPDIFAESNNSNPFLITYKQL